MGAEARGHPPGGEVADDLEHGQVLREKDGVDRKAHERHVNRGCRAEQDALARRKVTASEEALRAALRACGAKWTELPGEGAFYGPKIEYHLKDSIGRAWQVGTMQVDFMMPQRLGAEFVDEQSARRTPVMLHRAIVGSMERFIGILLEHYAGAMPLWLAPVQVVLMNVTDRQESYVRDVEAALKDAGFRAAADLRNEKITYKIREHSIQKLPYQLVLGDKEVAAKTVSARTRAGENLAPVPLEAFISRLRSEVEARK